MVIILFDYDNLSYPFFAINFLSCYSIVVASFVALALFFILVFFWRNKSYD